MASSSSVPSPKPSPYEVFLSFRGEDTRLTFVSHLHSALVGRGINTYYDEDKLGYGENLSIELPKAIQESAIAVVVLSENYASSTWCLRELVKIVECKNEGKLEIYPIFYEVEPTDVRKQQKSFDAFSNHEVNFKDNMEMVNAWRKALTEVSNLKGVESRGKYEASVIGEIADKISWKLPLEASHFKKSLVGMESRISATKVLINKNRDEVRFIGFYGMGGVGKTTTVRAIFDNCESEFEGSCFLEDVKKKKNKMEKLQQQLLSEVLTNCKIDRIYDVFKGTKMISNRMCCKRILLVIDDVDDIEQLDALAGHRSWFGPGSRIIITTRNAHLLNNVDDMLEIGTLNDKEALLLFRNHAFKRNEHPEENYMKLSHQVLRYAGGLPLALKVLGNYLDGQEESFWLDALKRLKEVPEDDIISILRISFDGLKSYQQDIFLHIACFSRGEHCDVVMEKLRALGLYPGEGIRVLIQKSLIRHDYISHDYPSFEMHDLLQDMGHHIVRQRANWEVRRYSHLWQDKDIKNVLLEYKEPVEARGILMDKNSYRDAIDSKILKEESFKNMDKLRFMKINSQINSHHEYQYLMNKAVAMINIKMFIQNGGIASLRLSNFMRVPIGEASPKFKAIINCLKGRKSRSSMELSQPSVQLPHGLQLLYWGEYPGKCLGKWTDLAQLEMPDSKIETTPDFNHMPNLEVLDLSDSDYLVHIHPSLGLHMKMKRINLSYCRQLEEFPAIIQMDSLEHLDLSRTGLRNFPELCGPNLLNLDLSRCKQLSEVHASLGVHKKIVRINLNGCRSLKEFPKIVDMGCLESLNLSDTNLQCFPEITGIVDNLAILDLSMTCITTLPQSIGRATGLQELNLGSCGHLVSLPISLQALEKLKIIEVALRESDLRVKDLRALFAPKLSLEVVKAGTVDGQKEARTDLEDAVLPKISVEGVNARDFPLKGNVIHIFVATVILVVVMVLLWFVLKLVKMMDAGI